MKLWIYNIYYLLGMRRGSCFVQNTDQSHNFCRKDRCFIFSKLQLFLVNYLYSLMTNSKILYQNAKLCYQGLRNISATQAPKVVKIPVKYSIDKKNIGRLECQPVRSQEFLWQKSSWLKRKSLYCTVFL